MKIGNRTILYSVDGKIITDVKNFDTTGYKATAWERGKRVSIHHFKKIK